MKKLFAILFSTLIFFQSTNLLASDVVSISELIEHAELHKERYGDNFMVFLSKHYGELKESHKEQHQNEEQEQQKTIHLDCAYHHLDLINHAKGGLIPFREMVDTHAMNSYYQDKFSSFEKQKVFRPPKMG